MNYTGSAPARQAVPELPEHNLPVAPGVKKTSQGCGNLVAYLRLLWGRKGLAKRTVISVDRKSQVNTLAVTDNDPNRAAAVGEAYVEGLNRLVSELSASSPRMKMTGRC